VADAVEDRLRRIQVEEGYLAAAGELIALLERLRSTATYSEEKKAA
jgi:hypothetical protein